MPTTKFTKETARENQAKAAAARRANKEAGREDVSKFVNEDMVELLFVLPREEAVARLKEPKTLAEKIVKHRLQNDKMNWEMLQDIMDRVLGKPRQAIDANVQADMNITLDTTGLYGDDKQ